MANYKIKQYRGRHNWVERRLGKPKYCVNCNTIDENTIYHWANISGNYLKDLTDWKRMCIGCHRKETLLTIPRKEFCLNGHSRYPDNLYPSGACKECRKSRYLIEYMSRRTLCQ